MYTATAIYQDSEIGFGEGYSDGYAVEECVDSIPSIYKDMAREDIVLFVRDSSGIVYVNNLLQYEIATN
jgi:hypothetical protein